MRDSYCGGFLFSVLSMSKKKKEKKKKRRREERKKKDPSVITYPALSSLTSHGNHSHPS